LIYNSKSRSIIDGSDRFANFNKTRDIPPKSRSDFSATFTTIAFDDSSLRWLEINT
jgi:hypothetical protein